MQYDLKLKGKGDVAFHLAHHAVEVTEQPEGAQQFSFIFIAFSRAFFVQFGCSSG